MARYPNVTMKINPPVHQRVTAIKQAMEEKAVRQVSYSEVLDQLASHWETTERLLSEAKRLGATISIDPEQATMPLAPDLTRLADLT